MPAPEPLTAVPTSWTAGDTWLWTRTLDDYTPGAGWAFLTSFRGAGSLDVAGVAASDGLSWELTAAAAATAVLPAGVYTVAEFVTYAATRYQVGRGSVLVRPNPALLKPGDGRPWEEACVANLQAYLAGSTEEGVLEFSIAGRATKLYTPEQAMALLDKLTDRLARKTARGNRRPPIVPVFRAL